MRRSFAMAATATTLTLGLAACGSSGGSGSSSSGKAPAAAASVDPSTVSGTITWWDTSDATSEAPAYKTLIAQFEAKYPKIKVNYQNVPFSDARDKFKTAAQSGSGAPDIIRSDVGWVSSFAQLGYAQPLDGTAAMPNASDFLPSAYASTQYQGKTYGVPLVTDTLALMYNKALFAQAGIASPPTTWAEMKADALAIKAKTGANGAFLKAQGYYALPFIYGEGGNLVDAQTKTITVDDAKAQAGVGIATDMLSSGAAVTDVTTDAYTNMQTMFKDGKVGMVVNGPWSVSDDFSGSAFADRSNLGIAQIPAGSAGAGAPTGGHDLVVYAGSKHLDADYLFVNFLTSADSEAYAAQQNHVLPTRVAAYSLPAVSSDPTIASFRTALNDARPGIQVPGVTDIYDPMDTDMEKIYSGQTSVKAGLDDTAQQAKKILPDFS